MTPNRKHAITKTTELRWNVPGHPNNPMNGQWYDMETLASDLDCQLA